MTWDPATSNGFESAKIRFEALPYLARGGLDLGCGVQKVWPHMVGVDSGLDAALFGAQVNADINVADASKLPIFADASWPAVFSSHLLEHIKDWTAALREWWRVLKVGGHLCLYLPHRDLYPRIGEPGANPDHKQDFDEGMILDAMRLIARDWALVENERRAEGNEYSFWMVFRKEPEGTGQSGPWADPKPRKTAGIVRVGGNGDALWAGALAGRLHADGYAVTIYCQDNGAEVLRNNPAVAGFKLLPRGVLTDDELLTYWAHEAVKYDKWVNLIGSVEGRLIPHQEQVDFYLPQSTRHKLMDINYLDMVWRYAELDMLPGDAARQKFHPTPAERDWAQKMRAELPGPVVVIAPTGSGPFKRWPHAQAFMQRMAEAGVYTVMLGDLKSLPDLDMVTVNGTDYGHVVGMEWPLRAALAYAQLADAVVATESVIANAVAMEPMPKVVMLSHSSNRNLTRDWVNCAALEASVACHPCHRIHNAGGVFCAKDTTTSAAACMASYGPDLMAELVLRMLGRPVTPDGAASQLLAAEFPAGRLPAAPVHDVRAAA